MAYRPVIPETVLTDFGLKPLEITVMEGGHINDTYYISTADGEFVLQRINHFVFPSPENVMENIDAVTRFLQEKIRKEGGDPARETLSVHRTLDGKTGIWGPKGNFWRCTTFIGGASSHEVAEGPGMLEEAGFAFGRFQQLLADYPADTLHEIIKDFHNTPARFEQLKEAVRNNTAGRLAEVEAELNFAYEREERCGLLMRLLESGELPLKVTHNDTKMSNILMDDKTGKAVCVIDLDTVMPGLTAFDFGDSIRAGATTAAEDEANLSIVHFDLERFEAFTKGFLRAAGSALTQKELETLPDGAILMTFEVGIRFLADYLNGDVYFRVSKPRHNLDRARNQFKLVQEMEENRAHMDAIVKKFAE